MCVCIEGGREGGGGQSRTSLPVRKHSAVEALHSLVHNRLDHLVKHGLLAHAHVKGTVEREPELLLTQRSRGIVAKGLCAEQGAAIKIKRP